MSPASRTLTSELKGETFTSEPFRFAIVKGRDRHFNELSISAALSEQATENAGIPPLELGQVPQRHKRVSGSPSDALIQRDWQEFERLWE